MKVLAGTILSAAIGWAVQWHVLSRAGTERLAEVQFADSPQGWTIAPHDLYHTTDRGRTWSVERSFTDTSFGGLAVVDSNHFFVAYSRLICPRYVSWWVWIDECVHGTWLRRYTNGERGVEWGPRACRLTVLDSTHLWHLGWLMTPFAGVAVRTTDGGANWQVFHDFLGGKYYDASFVDTVTGYATWDEIAKSTNAGDSWQILTSDGGARRIQMFDSLNGWVLSTSGLLHTTDGWASRDTAVTESGLQTLRFCSPQHGVAVGLGGVILHTTDSGVTWLPDTAESNLDPCAVWMVDSAHAWAAGENGIVLGMGDWAAPGLEEQARRRARSFELTGVRPSPCRGILWFECRGGDGPVVVYDGCGRPVERVRCKSSRAEKLDLRDLPEGAYFVRATSSPGPGVRFVLLR